VVVNGPDSPSGHCNAGAVEASSAPVAARPLASRRHLADRVGDVGLYGLTALAALGVFVLLGAIAYKVFDGAWPAISKFGLSFLWNRTWNPVTSVFGALDFIYGTAITSILAVVVAAPISIAIALFLTELAPAGLRGIVGSLVDMLAAVPSVVLGLWGILVLGPVVKDDFEPALGAVLGWTPFFRGQHLGQGYLTAIIVLTIMIVPIASAICRELFLVVPQEIKEGAYGLGLTRWEMVRGVILPYTRGGVVAAILLGMGRAVGEAIAVTQVIGGTSHITLNLFSSGDTLASRIAAQYQAAATKIHISAIVYLGAILLVYALLANFFAQVVVGRVQRRALGR
jgi:phosphate transport system permease protein